MATEKPSAEFAEASKEIVEHLRIGCPFEIAAQAAGISLQRAERWIARGQAGEEPYRSFLAQCAAAEQASFDEPLARIKAAARAGKRGAKAWLAKRGISESDDS